MPKVFNTKLGSMLVALVLIFSILALCVLGGGGSVAWFASKSDVSASGIGVKVKADLYIGASLSCHAITNIENGVYTISEEESYTLPRNDPNGISYSKYFKALAVILTIDSHVDQDVYLTLEASSSIDTIASNENKISNCIQISPATLGEGEKTAQKGDTSHRFVTVEGGTATKVNTLELDTIHATAGVHSFCYLIEYDESLLAYISRQVLATNTSNMLINYSNDIVFKVTT